MRDLKTFISQYCPNFEYYFDGAMKQAPRYWDKEQKELWVYYDLFPKAIANYRYELCELQRKNCAEAISDLFSGNNNICLDADSPDI